MLPRVSRVNTIGRRLQEMEGPQQSGSFWQHLFGKKKEEIIPFEVLGIRAPDIDFIRAEVLLEDISEIAGGVEIGLDQLISILYLDFLNKVRRAEDLHSFFIALRKMWEEFSPRKRVMELDSVTANRLAIRSKTKHSRVRLLQIDVHISHQYVKRGEAFLLDIQRFDSAFSLYLEDLISLLFIQMVENVRMGEQQKIIRDILKHSSSYTDF